MRISAILVGLIVFASPASAWERLVTQTGVEIEGDVTQPEFVLKEASGGEVAIPRAAIERLEATVGGLTATIKDGTKVVGTLEGKFEIEDGLIRRRYVGSDIQRIDFDQYIVVKPGKQYHSCPIRIDASAGELLFGEGSGFSVSWPRAVNCKGLMIANIAYSRRGKLKTGKETAVSAEFSLIVPAGNDQLIPPYSPASFQRERSRVAGPVTLSDGQSGGARRVGQARHRHADALERCGGLCSSLGFLGRGCSPSGPPSAACS